MLHLFYDLRCANEIKLLHSFRPQSLCNLLSFCCIAYGGPPSGRVSMNHPKNSFCGQLESSLTA